jgi:hypothetical protein
MILYLLLLHCYENYAVFQCYVLHAKYTSSFSDMITETTNVHTCLQVPYIIL